MNTKFVEELTDEQLMISYAKLYCSGFNRQYMEEYLIKNAERIGDIEEDWTIGYNQPAPETRAWYWLNREFPDESVSKFIGAYKSKKHFSNHFLSVITRAGDLLKLPAQYINYDKVWADIENSYVVIELDERVSDEGVYVFKRSSS